MGLETVELVMDIEKHYGIQIPDQEASRMRTVGDLYAFILSVVQIQDSPVCRTHRAFNLLRRAIVTELVVDRRAVTPEVTLRDLAPFSAWASRWTSLSSSSGLPFPPLVSQGRIFAAKFLGGSVFVAGIASLVITPAWCWVFLFFATMLLSAKVFLILAPRGGVSVNLTVRDLVYATVRQTHRPNRKAAWTREQVWLDLCGIVSEQFGVAVNEIDHSTDFVRDLNAG